ncbi:MAG: serine hydrolase domain-containing protein [Bryobacteraceae bacterium]
MRRLLLWALIAGAGLARAADFDAIFAPLVDAKSPGIAVLVRQNGRTVFERGYGVRDLRTLAPIDARTDFRLASFTKQFTAMAAMLLVHDGKLHYDERLTGIFPGFPAYGRAITIRHLLTHTSGLPDYEDLMQGGNWTAEHQIQDEEVLRLLEHQTAGKFAPGASWAYSNSGYVMLGLVVAKISGEPFAKFLDERIFRPLHMARTLVYLGGRNEVPDRAYGHTKGASGFTETDQSPTSATQGDGGIYSNLEDLAKWVAALESHTLLSENEMRPALTPVTLNDGSQPHWPVDANDDNLHPGQPVAYGFGWFLDPFKGRARMWHTGGTMGFRTVIERFTGEKLTVVVLCNRTDLDPEKLALQASCAIFGPNCTVLLPAATPAPTQPKPAGRAGD